MAKIVVESYQYDHLYPPPPIRPYVYEAAQRRASEPLAHSHSNSEDPVDSANAMLDWLKRMEEAKSENNYLEDDEPNFEPHHDPPPPFDDLPVIQNDLEERNTNFEDGLGKVLHNRQGLKRSIQWVYHIIDHITHGLKTLVPPEWRVFVLNLLERFLFEIDKARSLLSVYC